MDDKHLPDERALKALLRQFRQHVRRRELGWAAQKSYVKWVERYILYHRKQHPARLGAREVADFLHWLELKHAVPLRTRTQAREALDCLYRDYLGKPLGSLRFPRHGG